MAKIHVALLGSFLFSYAVLADLRKDPGSGSSSKGELRPSRPAEPEAPLSHVRFVYENPEQNDDAPKPKKDENAPKGSEPAGKKEFDAAKKSVEEHFSKVDKLEEKDAAVIEGLWKGGCERQTSETNKDTGVTTKKFVPAAAELDFKQHVRVVSFDLEKPNVGGVRQIQAWCVGATVVHSFKDGFIIAEGKDGPFNTFTRKCAYRKIEKNQKKEPYLFCSTSFHHAASTVRITVTDENCVYTRPENVQIAAPKKP